MKNIDLIKLASDIAFANAANPNSQMDAALAAEAVTAKMPDPDYNRFKQYATQFLAFYRQGVQLDAQVAAQAAAKAPAPAA